MLPLGRWVLLAMFKFSKPQKLWHTVCEKDLGTIDRVLEPKARSGNLGLAVAIFIGEEVLHSFTGVKCPTKALTSANSNWFQMSHSVSGWLNSTHRILIPWM
jgi:hypothetical protein